MTPKIVNGYKIRTRDRRGYVREALGYTGWSEWQVVGVRGRVLGRFDFEYQATKFAENQPPGPFKG